MPPSISPSPPALLIRPTRGLAALNLRDLWLYRELIYFMTWRDLLVRYKQTVLGVSWAVLQPVLQMVVFDLLFNRMAGLSAEGFPYPIFNFTALLPWNMFAHALNVASRSLVSNRNMLTKIYFPRVIIPLSSIIASVVDFLIGSVVLVGLMIYYHLQPTAHYRIEITPALLWLPAFFLLAFISTLGVSLWLSALNVVYRDVGHVIPFLTQIWLFITPVVYSSREISASWRVIYALNPMVGVVDGFRWAILGTQAPDGSVWVSVMAAVAVLLSGMVYFRRMERTFADEI